MLFCSYHCYPDPSSGAALATRDLLEAHGLLGTTLESVPAEVPYLHAEPARVESRGRRLGGEAGLRVGIVWQGNLRFQWDRHRSVPLSRFAPLAAVDGVRLVSLQKGPGNEQLAAAARRFPVEVLGDDFDAAGGAFLDTAAAMKNLDLVVCCDTAAVHLAAAPGVPAWLALSGVCDWRWLRHREDTPWYPTVRLFRQDRLGEWGPVFERMAAGAAGCAWRSLPANCSTAWAPWPSAASASPTPPGWPRCGPRCCP